jgi:hypothetical protein
MVVFPSDLLPIDVKLLFKEIARGFNILQKIGNIGTFLK